MFKGGKVMFSMKYELRLEIEKDKYKLIRSNSLNRLLSKLIKAIKYEWPKIYVNTSELWYNASIASMTLFCKYEGKDEEVYFEFDCYGDINFREFRDRLIDGINN